MASRGEAVRQRRERRVWRAATSTLVVVWIFMVVAVVAIPALAVTLLITTAHPVIAGVLLALTVAAALYGWRFGLHPRLVLVHDQLTVHNPLHTTRLPLQQIRAVEPGPDGLRLRTDDGRVIEAWCVQKSNAAIRAGRLTRADRIVSELRGDLPTPVSAVRSPRSVPSPPEPIRADPLDDLIIRRAHPDEALVLTRLEQAASASALHHVFPPSRFPYPYDTVAQRWRETFTERHVRVRIAEWEERPVGYLAYSRDQIRHLGVHPDFHRRGVGSELLGYATRQIFTEADHAWLWVLQENETAQAFYRHHGFTRTEEQQTSPYEPHPVEIKMIMVRPE